MITVKYIILCLFPVMILVNINGNLTNKEKYKNLKTILSSIKESCGNVCDQSFLRHENAKSYAI